MHKSIKSYFTVISKKKAPDNSPNANTKQKRDPSSDEDVERLSPKKRQKPVKRSTKRRVLSDSEDEIVESRKATPSRTNKKALQKTVSPADVFDTRPVKRIEAPQPSKKLSAQDGEFVFDEKFVAVLDQLETSHTKQSSKTVKLGKTIGNATNTVSNEIGTTKIQSSTHRSSNSDKKLTDDEISGCNKNTGIETNTKSDRKEKEEVMKNNSEMLRSSKNETSKAVENNKKTSNDIPYKKGISKLIIEKQDEQKKRKRSNEDQESDPYEDMIQKKKRGQALYQQYLHRGGARNPGSKEIPTGADNCLAGKSFVITGVLDSLERHEADDLIKKYGGRVVAQVSKKTDYMVLGDEPGPAKLEKAKKLGIKTISEDDLLDMIRTRPAGQATPMTGVGMSPVGKLKNFPNRAKRKTPEPEPLTITLPNSPPKAKDRSHPISKLPEDNSKTLTTDKPSAVPTSPESETRAWVEKYKPKSMKQIIGQQGDKSNAHKLHNWLQNWQKNQCGNVKHPRPSPWAQHDGSFFKAALLSGPPGVGKTTTVQVVCEALGLDALEFNASDTRSKRLLKEEVSELLSNKSMKGYFVDSRSKKPDLSHVLVMDEVDGMAGNEDRGGLQELIALIKTTNVPVICICNDRNHPKMRTLSNYTYDLRFQKPRIEQIRGAMMSICFKEKINITAEDLNRLIESTNNDIRQVLNHLSLFTKNSSVERSPEQRRVNKDLKLGPWDVVGKVFSAEAHKTMSIHDKSDLFFHDYNISSLFVQENYLGVTPNCPKNKVLEMVADSAESLALGDLIENAIRKTGAWSLLPTQACYSSVIPGTLMSGHMTKQITFPAWLGQNSRRGKFDRLLQEITIHTRLATAASKDSLNLDYLKPLRDAVVRPLVVDGADGTKTALDVMSYYHLLREDLDSLIEVSLWPGQHDPMQTLESKVKAAFTRAFNKSSIMRPYALKKSTEKKKKSDDTNSENFSQSDAEEPESDDNDDLSTDPMIKLKKPIKAVKETVGAKKKTSKAANTKSKVRK
ncbi:replication factor C subunit 1 isoform X2 [Athalia rosae]|uniref:replication factor C subunit 1 isoform X2 n=1 Tax=Athalia rosae TaxID=37344 RepID=UPI0020344A4A|nr:replication factor C subunit 1 isoform X2 [Athalia rosae]